MGGAATWEGTTPPNTKYMMICIAYRDEISAQIKIYSKNYTIDSTPKTINEQIEISNPETGYTFGILGLQSDFQSGTTRGKLRLVSMTSANTDADSYVIIQYITAS